MHFGYFTPAFAGAAALALAAFAAPVHAQQVIKATDVHPLGYPTVEAIVRMGGKLEKATSGKYKLQMFPSMQLAVKRR